MAPYVPQTPRLARASKCSITELSPIVNEQDSKFVDGVVSLIWPYSSSDRRTAILLADPDFRKRREKGQTKVTFHGDSAVVVAESHVGIGDTVHLSLDGAQWAHAVEDVSTFGERADWDLEYVGEVFMEVHRGTIPLAVIDLHHPSESVDGPLRAIALNGGPKTRTPVRSRNQESWSSPAFSKQRSLPADSLARIALGTVIEDDGYIAGRGRKRTRFSRDSGSWRYLERTPSLDEENHAPESASLVRSLEEIIQKMSAPRSDDAERVVDVVDPRASEQPAPPARHYDAPINSEEAPELMMPPPPVVVKEPRLAGELSPTRSATEVEETSTRQVDEHQQDVRVATPPRAITPRILPLPSPGLLLISPLVKQHGAAVGYSPAMSIELSELDSSAELVSKDLVKEIEPGAASLPSGQAVSTSESVMSPLADATAATVVRPAGSTIALTSPTEQVEEREELGRGMQIESPTSGHAGNLELLAIRSDEFEFLHDSQVEPQPVVPISFVNVVDQRSKTITEAAVLDYLTKPSFADTPSNQPVHPPVSQGEQDSTNLVSGCAGSVATLSPLEQTSKFLIDQVDGRTQSHVISRNAPAEQKDTEQDDTLPVHLFAPRAPHWTEALEVSAREVEGHDLYMSAPPFPFKQRWDTVAKKESKALQAVKAMQAGGPYITRRSYYDGVEEATRSSLADRSDSTSSPTSGRICLIYDDDGNLIRQVERLENNAGLKGDYSQISDRAEGTSPVADVNDLEPNEMSQLEFDNNETSSVKVLDIKHGMKMQTKTAEDTDPEVISKSTESDVNSIDDEFGHRSPPSVEGQYYVQRLAEMPLSRSPSVAPASETDLVDVSSTPSFHVPPDPHIEEHVVIQAYAAENKITDRPSSREPDRPCSRVDQLATPENSQQEAQHSQFRDLRTEQRDEKPQVELPPSPQNTQDLQHSQLTKLEMPLSAKEEQETMSPTHAALQPKSDFEETEMSERWTAPGSEERHRRSSRLSGKMPLLGKDPSEIVSPYFTPNGPSQYSDNQEVPSSPPHQPLSRKAKGRGNIVVLIPPSTEKRSQLDVQGHLTSVTLTSTESASPKHYTPAPGFTTPHSYYPSLSSLLTHFNDEVDILAVIATNSKQPQRAKSGPRDYFTSLKLADLSCDAGDTVSIQLFRPYKTALPTCVRGDVLLLRGMKVQTRRALGTRGKSQGKNNLDGMMLLSTHCGAWAVFKFPSAESISGTDASPGSRDGSARSPAKRGTPSKMDVQINGPPVEFGAEERAFARGLSKWWSEEGEASFPDVRSKPSQKTKGKGKEKNSALDLDVPNETLHDHELRDGMAYGDMISPRPLHEHPHRGPYSHHGDPEDVLHEHELRDGMAYGDTISQTPLHEHQHDHNLDHPHIHIPNTSPLADHDDHEAEE